MDVEAERSALGSFVRSFVRTLSGTDGRSIVAVVSVALRKSGVGAAEREC